MNNKKLRRHFSAALTPKSIGILLIFSFIVTLLAFAAAYNEHRQVLALSQKYDEAIVKINNCEEVLSALVKQMENPHYSEVTINPTTAEDEAPTADSAVSPTEESITEAKNESSTTKPDTTEKATTTAKAPSTSGTYFVTQSGKKYHIASCSYLSKSKIPISMDRIKSGGYSPCSRCIK